MGVNSQGVAYDFGQMGSMLVTGTAAFNPPNGMVIVAITSLDDDTDFADTVGLVSELNTDNIGGISVSNFVTTAAAGGHVDGEVTDADPHNGNNATGLGGVTGKVETAANMVAAGVKPGMLVHTTGSMLPYSSTDPFVVKSVDTDHFIVTKGRQNNDAVVTSAGVSDGANEACFFYSARGQGVGGIQATASNMQIPSGATIYGRWTSGKLAAGKIIAYFGI